MLRHQHLGFSRAGRVSVVMDVSARRLSDSLVSYSIDVYACLYLVKQSAIFGCIHHTQYFDERYTQQTMKHLPIVLI